MKMLLRAGTESDKLSQVQTDLVCQFLKNAVPEVALEKKIVSPGNGNRERVTPFFVQAKRGAGEREIFRAVKDGRVDFIVQSLKHVPVFEGEIGLTIAGVLERSSPAEVFVSRDHLPLRNLTHGSIVETSNSVRLAQLRRVRGDVQARTVDGTLEVRIRRVEEGECDGAILSEAGLSRLGMTEKIAERLAISDFVTFPGQGIIAIVTRNDNQGAISLLKMLDHRSTRAEAEAERQLVRTFSKECDAPVAALANASGDRVQIIARVLSQDGQEKVDVTSTGNITEAQGVGVRAGRELVSSGAKRLEDSWKKRRR